VIGMASASRYGGPSYTAAELADPAPPVRVRRPELGRVDQERYDPREAEPSDRTDGGHSIQSSGNESTPNESQRATPRKAARTTGNRSKAKEQGSTAHTTGGDGPEAAESFDDFDEFA
jgi:hypothetical protein